MAKKKTVKKIAKKISKKTAKKITKKSPKKIVKKTAKKIVKKVSKKAIKKTTAKPVKKTTLKPVKKTTKKIIKKTTIKPIKKTIKKIIKKTTIKPVKKTTKKIIKKTTKKIIKKVIKKTVSTVPKKNITKQLIKKILPKKTIKSKTSFEPKYNLQRLHQEEQKIEESKFYLGTPNHQEPFNESRFELPENYGENKIVLLARDPHWMYTYWDLSGGRIEQLKQEHGHETIDSSRMVLRIKDVTEQSADQANNFYDIEVSYGSKNWYLNVPECNRTYCVDLGFITNDGRFILIVRSNTVPVPRDTFSDVLDEEWASVEDYNKIYALSGGFDIGLSSGELKKMMKKKLQDLVSSGAVPSSHIVAGKKGKQRSFFLVVNTELIVYGVTVPDANLTIQGKPKKLNPDGTFRVQFALPDGLQNIPVKSISNDGIDEITITPIVTKDTK